MFIILGALPGCKADFDWHQGQGFHGGRRRGNIKSMSQTYGIESPVGHVAPPPRQAVRYVVVIDAGGAAITRLMLDTREQVAEFDAGTPEVVQMIQGLAAAKVAHRPEWDAALRGHSAEERMAADVYTLDV